MKNILLAGFMVLNAALVGADFSIVKNGKPEAVVIKNPKAERAQKFLILEAAKCGVKLPLAETAEKGNQIVFEVKDASMEVEDAFTIDYPDSRTMRISCTSVSARWAANHILETAFGVKWLFPHLPVYGKEDINDYPKAVNIAVKAEKYVRKPYSFYINRGMGWKYATPWNSNLGHKLNMNYAHWIMVDVFPVWKYAPDQSWPEEIMPVWKGKKLKLPKPKSLPLPKNPWLAKRSTAPNPLGVTYEDGWNPCFSHPKTAEIAIANILEKLERNPEQKVITMSTNDNGGFCQCDACRKATGGKRNSWGYEDHSEVYWGWLNKVAEAVSKKHPDVWFTSSAYRETLNPPSFKMHPRVAVKICLETHSFTHPKARAMHLANLKAWSERAACLLIYDYDHGKGFFLFPRLALKLHSTWLKKFYRDYHVRGMYTEADFLPFDCPKFRLMYRLMRDIDADPEEIIESWYRDAVGSKAAPALRKYFQFWDDYWMGEDIRRTEWYKSATNVYMQLGERPTHTFALKRGDMKKLRALMTEVVEKAETPQQKRRAIVLMGYFEYSEAAAKALFSELIPPEARLGSAAEAVELLKQVPAAIEAAERFRKNPYNALERNEKPLSILSTTLLNIGLVLPFVKDPAVRVELKKLENDERLPGILRGQIKIWLGFKAKNLIENGSFEKETPMLRPLWMPRLNGKRDTRHVSDGKYSFRTGNGYYILTPKMEPGKTYLFLCDLFIEQGSNEGRFSYRLGPSKGVVPRNWVRQDLVLTGGTWNTYSAAISHPRDIDNLQIHLYFQKFENTEPVWIDNLRLYCLDDMNIKTNPKKEEKKMNLKKSKAASTVMAAAACMVMSAAGDLPKELEGTPKDQIQEVSQYIYGTKAEDPEAPGSKVVVYIPSKNAKKYGGFQVGVYDKKYSEMTKKVIAYSRHRPADEKYHWYKISRTGRC